jgi:uncharacterized protein
MEAIIGQIAAAACHAARRFTRRSHFRQCRGTAAFLIGCRRMELSPFEIRVLGCLMEKQVTTPDQYPLTANSLRLACNQSTNRNPVVDYSEHEILTALNSLREQHLIRIVYSTSNRATKYRHIVDEAWQLEAPEYALMAVLALRGAQTVGELNQRTDRMHSFASLDQVQHMLDELAARPEPLVVRLSRRPGQHGERYMHLLAGPVDEEALDAAAASSEPRPSSSGARIDALEERVAELEAKLEHLTARLNEVL